MALAVYCVPSGVRRKMNAPTAPYRRRVLERIWGLPGSAGTRLGLEIEAALHFRAEGDRRLYRRRARALLHQARRDPTWCLRGRRSDVIARCSSGESVFPYRYAAASLCGGSWPPWWKQGAPEAEEEAPPAVGAERCPRCRSRRTTYSLLQTRSGDEGMTQFWFCEECGRRWKHG